MIKKIIKNQIRKTKMVQELENNNKKLKSQLDKSNKVNKQLNIQIKSLNAERRSLKSQLAEKTELVGFSLKTNLRGLSSDEGKIPVLQYIVENVEKQAKILDVGFGAGAYGKLLRSLYYQNIDGLDVYGDNIKEMRLDMVYDNIFIENILDFDFDYYDLIIMGDVLEHIDLQSAKNLLNNFIQTKKCGKIVVSVPYCYEQDVLYGNSYEVHLQPEIDQKYMEIHYPCLKLINQVKSITGHIIATYCWENSKN